MKPMEGGPGKAKAPTGVDGLDEITGGGLPRGGTTVFLGEPGTGKTVLALQTLVNGARAWGEPGIFCAFEENSRRIVANAATLGWDLPALEKARLFFLDTRMSLDAIRAGSFDLAGMLASLRAKAAEIGARRIAFDSIEVLLSLLDDPLMERRELERIHEWLGETGLTGIVTARARADVQFKPHDFLLYMADAVISLQQQLAGRVALRQLRVLKYRGSSFAENAFPLVIGPTGIEVANFGLTATEWNYPVSTERVSTGVARLDAMMESGYYRGSSVLITGSPGTAKSALCGAFIEAACKRGERSLYVSFDEGPREIVRNLVSVNVWLEPHIRSGLLRMYATRTQACSAEAHLVRLHALIREHRPLCLVIDPLSALVNAGGVAVALAVAQQLLHLAKELGITVVLTSLPESSFPEAAGMPLAISTMADTWIHLAYRSQRIERARTLTIVKSRGTNHSNQVCDLLLSREGIRLVDRPAPSDQAPAEAWHWEQEMATQRQEDSSLSPMEEEQVILRLYITADAPGSTCAIKNLEILCQEHLQREYQLEVIDLTREPFRALEDGVLVTPTLVKLSPAPTRKVIGDLSDIESVFSALALDGKKS